MQINTPSSSMYSNLARSDFRSLTTLREFSGGRHFKSDEEVKAAVWACLNGLAVEGCGEGIQKLVTGHGKSLNVAGDYIE
jgi:hypothetical protein